MDEEAQQGIIKPIQHTEGLVIFTMPQPEKLKEYL
jgi:hypothetical protein